jgi:acyl carrier protein
MSDADTSFEQLKVELKQLILQVCDVRGVDPQAIGDDDYLINGDGALKLESLDAIEIAMAVEKTYGLKMNDISSAKERLRSINSLASFIHKSDRPKNSTYSDSHASAP